MWKVVDTHVEVIFGSVHQFFVVCFNHKVKRNLGTAVKLDYVTKTRWETSIYSQTPRVAWNRLKPFHEVNEEGIRMKFFIEFKKGPFSDQGTDEKISIVHEFIFRHVVQFR